MSSNLPGKKDFWYHHAVVFSIQKHQVFSAERMGRAVADPVPFQYWEALTPVQVMGADKVHQP